MCLYALIAGGNWSNGAYCGSRYRNANNVRSNVNTNISGRGSIRGIRCITPVRRNTS